MAINQDIRVSSTLPGEFYNSATKLQESKLQIFEKSWQIICDNETIKTTNSAFPFDFMEGFITEPLLLVRDKNDEIICLSNVCTHRGAVLIDHPCQLSGNITCPYHGRRFDMEGKFKSMPETHEMENFPTQKDDLHTLNVKKWKQFLFTSLEPTFEFEKLITEMNERIGWMPIENFIYSESRSQEYLVKANWALYIDNYLEGFHIPFIHPDLSKSLDYSTYSSEIYPYSNLQIGVGKSGDICFELPKYSKDYGKNIAAYYFWLFPNIW